MSVILLPVVEACVVMAVRGRVGEVRVAADEPEAADLDPGVLARGLDAPATVKRLCRRERAVAAFPEFRSWRRKKIFVIGASGGPAVGGVWGDVCHASMIDTRTSCTFVVREVPPG